MLSYLLGSVIGLSLRWLFEVTQIRKFYTRKRRPFKWYWPSVWAMVTRRFMSVTRRNNPPTIKESLKQLFWWAVLCAGWCAIVWTIATYGVTQTILIAVMMTTYIILYLLFKVRELI